MDAKQAFRSIKQGNVSPIYVCFGTETYIMNEFVERLLEHSVQPEHRDMAVIRFDTGETSIDSILEEAETLPFLVPSKIILVRDSVLFASGKESSRIEHRPESLLAYMGQPSDTTVLVFMVHHEKLDERKKLVKTAKANDAVVSFSPLQPEELLQWLLKRASNQGRAMENHAAEELLRRVGTDMHALAAETDKLCLHAGSGGSVTLESVRSLVPMATEQNVFKLTEELAALRTAEAIKLYHDLLKQREEPIKLMALLVRQFRNMLYVKELGNQGYSPQQMASQIGLHPYAVKITGEQARKFSQERLANLLSELADLDYAMKTGRVEKTLGLELFLLKTGSQGAS
ncbi:DNA polymerase III subunit delta [Cohnella cholangitidis]|uniref:DNA polymerase III subunit delta n=1 Tax=Cohnella cholangitidis TaxID=2598458 RepID=A0A7G5BU28_9BACL|nr:DNA polymerase III subunit delta [Cohnella cholangitidis]QMV40462.1 DNA polymerase III subunit delta [Cohnella cholangitidis]